MHNTEPITPTASGPPTLRDAVAEIDPLIGAVYVAGPPVLVAWAGTILFALMLAGPFALVATFVVVLVAAAAVVTLAALAGGPGRARADPGHWLGQAGRALARDLAAGIRPDMA